MGKNWPSNIVHFIYMEKRLFNITYYVYPRSISIDIMTGCRSILSTRTWRKSQAWLRGNATVLSSALVKVGGILAGNREIP